MAIGDTLVKFFTSLTDSRWVMLAVINVFFLVGAGVALTLDPLTERAVAFAAGGLAGGLAAWFVMFPKMNGTLSNRH